MPYKTMMYIVGTVPLIFLIAFAAIPEFFVLQSYPSADGLALEIGITHRYIMSGMLFIVVCFAFLFFLSIFQQTNLDIILSWSFFDRS
ncbi:hypothetical protein OAK14_01390 [Candidatus Marinimicrobia bacterium]|nr:hypothetical protein [Candidatus Neomarinimicrobiota bacterium]